MTRIIPEIAQPLTAIYLALEASFRMVPATDLVPGTFARTTAGELGFEGSGVPVDFLVHPDLGLGLVGVHAIGQGPSRPPRLLAAEAVELALRATEVPGLSGYVLVLDQAPRLSLAARFRAVHQELRERASKPGFALSVITPVDRLADGSWLDQAARGRLIQA